MEKLWDELGELEASLERLKAEGEKLNAELKKIGKRGSYEGYAEFEALIEKYAKLIRAHSKLELEARGLQAETVYMKVKGGRAPVV
jgi:chromosome segregation ATPase